MTYHFAEYEDTCDASYAVTVCTYEADPEVRNCLQIKINSNNEAWNSSETSKDRETLTRTLTYSATNISERK
jgi:hypothetical protein